MRIVIPGGSGQVGHVLARHFQCRGNEVTVIARHPSRAAWETLLWDGKTLGDWVDAIDGADVVINLAGRSVNCRYTPSNREEIKTSRVQSTALIGEAIRKVAGPPRLWMNASTATIYRHALDRAMDEDTGELGGDEPGAPSTWRFSIDVAKSWEAAFFGADVPRTRKVALRSAMTMSPDPGGIFDTLLGLVRHGLGGSACSGTQYVSWVHDMDFACAMDFLIDHEEFAGPVNICSPNPLPYKEFMQILRNSWGMPVGLPATKWMLEVGAMLMSTETELVLKSRRVIPTRLLNAGFKFCYPEWRRAACDLVSRWRHERSEPC